MSAYVEWLPVGHVAHGYRRVFVVYENDKLRHIVNLNHLPYETVFLVREYGAVDEVKDPSLWWGLSVVSSLVADGTLLRETNPEAADDGYIQVRPSVPNQNDLIPVVDYLAAYANGRYVLHSSQPDNQLSSPSQVHPH